MDDWSANDFASCDIEIKEEPLDDPPDDAQEAESNEAALCFESVDVTSRDNLDCDAYPQACASYEDNLIDPLCDDSFVKPVMPSQDPHKTVQHLNKDPFYHPFKIKLEPVSYETPSDLLDAVSKNINGSSVSTDAPNEQIVSVFKIKEEKPDPDLHFEHPSETYSLENSHAPWRVNEVPKPVPFQSRAEQQGILKVKETVVNNELQSSWLFISTPIHNEKITGDLATEGSTLDQKVNKTLFLTYANNTHGSSPVLQPSLIIADVSSKTVNRKKSVHVPITPFAENSPLKQTFGSYTQSKPMKHKTDILLLSKPKKTKIASPSTCQQKLIEQLPPTQSVLNHKSRKQILTPRVEVPAKAIEVKIKTGRKLEPQERKCSGNTPRRILSRMINTKICDLSVTKSRELLALQSWNWCKPKKFENEELSAEGCKVEQSDCSEGSEDKGKSDTAKQELKSELTEELDDVCLAERLKTASDKLSGVRVAEPMKHELKSENSEIASFVEAPRKPRKQCLHTTRVRSEFSSVGSDSSVKSEQSVTDKNMFIPEDTLYISCTECRRMFLHDRHYKLHLKTFPNRYRSCQVCQEPCANVCSLQAHYVFHATDEGKSYCQLIKSDFHSKTLLLQYIQLFNNNQHGYFTCNCGKTFHLHNSFHKHIKQKFEKCKHKNVFKSLERSEKRKEHKENKRVKMTPVTSLPKCSTCDLEFYNRYDYLEHIRFAHLIIYTCDFCAYEVTNDKPAMNHHIKKHLEELEQHLPANS